MWRVYGGALMVIAGIATFIETHSHRPKSARTLEQYDAITRSQLAQQGVTPRPASGLSPDTYDLLRIGAWALVILGVLTIVLGLIRYYRTAASAV
jgi:uncharacterized membrane protein HdeD (DUF308 family)